MPGPPARHRDGDITFLFYAQDQLKRDVVLILLSSIESICFSPVQNYAK